MYVANHNVKYAHRQRRGLPMHICSLSIIFFMTCLCSHLSSIFCIGMCFLRLSVAFYLKRQTALLSLHWSFAFTPHAHWLSAASGAASQRVALQPLVMGRLYTATYTFTYTYMYRHVLYMNMQSNHGDTQRSATFLLN